MYPSDPEIIALLGWLSNIVQERLAIIPLVYLNIIEVFESTPSGVKTEFAIISFGVPAIIWQNETTYTDIIKEDKISEIESIQQRVVEFQKNAQQSLSEKEAELFIPIREKAMKAIDEVAEEGKFTFIFDSGSGSFLYAAESENIINLVKSKLGL